MAVIIESDDSGRIVIPKKIREELGITGKTQFILTKNNRGQILIQKLEIEEIAKRLREELKDTPVEDLARGIREEINERIKKTYQSIT
jgi:AbrB family looped-hinge helix DNA binding protein